MTLYINVGRRVPRSWMRRQGSRVAGLVSFQEHIWQIIKQSLNMAKKKANASGTIDFVLTKDKEIEDMNYEIEWIKIIIRGTEAQEKEEYEEAMGMYEPFGKIMKKDMPKDEKMTKHFKTKILNNDKVQEAYQQGYGSVDKNNISNKLLEMGILTHIEWTKDFDEREIEYKPDF